MKQRRIALVGLRCVGKTSVGIELARRLGVDFVDLDLLVVDLAELGAASAQPARPSVGDLLARLGEPAFRDLEQRALEAVLERPGPFVLATGGGVVERAENRGRLRRSAHCVWLREEVDVLQRRLAADSRPRPALLGTDPVAEVPVLAQRRDALYREVAEIALDCRGETPDRVAARVAELLAAAPGP